ncbi:MAG: putative bifunctional diguanylate cyclase/phosphodiesterase [Pseudonocardiaceae bacterium]
MTTPVQSAGPAKQGPPTRSGRSELARLWAKALDGTAYVPATRQDVERSLRALLDELVDILRAKSFSPAPAREVGVALVAQHYISEQSVSRTVELLGEALPAQPELQGVDRLTGKVIAVLGALAAGFAAALRARTLDQQEQVKQALLQANQDAERELRVSEAKFREVYTSSAAGIAISDLDGTVVETNQALGEILADPSADFTGRSLCELLHPDDVAPLKAACQEHLTAGRTRFRPPRRFRLIGRDGEPAWTYLAVSLLHDADGNPTHHVTIVEDVTELHLLGEQLRHQSLHDALTGLPNQQYFVSTLERALGRGGRVTVCTIDLDSFSVINDALGRQVGDKVLQRVAEQLQSVVAGQDATVARFGADRFAILIENPSPTPDVPTPDVAALAARINAALAEPAYFDNHGIAVSCGIGIASRDGGAVEPAELLRAAEAALHRVKSSSKRQWALYDPHRDDEHRARCRLAAAMPGAWESGEISVEYQPMERLHDGSVAAVQAMLRWDHPQQGLLPHQECLNLATRTGLALPLGQWMLHHAAEQFATWRKQRAEAGAPGPLLQIDLVGQHAHDPDLVTTVSCALDRAGLTADRLRIGMPVSALRTDQDEAADNLNVLSDLGVGIAMLGCSGAGAVAQLEDLPIDAVELAPHLVQRVADRGADSAVARAVPPLVHLMQTCGAQVIVRNLDNHHQAAWWHRAGADIAQGSYFAPPGPLS